MKKMIVFINEQKASKLLSMMQIVLAMLVILLLIGITINSDNLIRLAYGLACLSGTLVFIFWTKLSDGTVTSKKSLTKS